MESKARKWLKKNCPYENWDFKEGQIPDDQWKFIENLMEKYAEEQVGKIIRYMMDLSLPTDKEIIQKSKETCPKYQGKQKDAQCDGAYQSGFGLGALWIKNQKMQKVLVNKLK